MCYLIFLLIDCSYRWSFFLLRHIAKSIPNFPNLLWFLFRYFKQLPAHILHFPPSKMSSLKKSPLNKNAKQTSVNPKNPSYSSSNPFDSDDELDHRTTRKPARKTFSEPTLDTPNFSPSPLDDSGGKQTTSSSYSLSSTARNRYKHDFHDSGGIENQSVQDLGDYAVYKSEETTQTVQSCLKIAEDMRENATSTLVNLHHQGEQLTRTHIVAADLDHDLSKVWPFFPPIIMLSNLEV